MLNTTATRESLFTLAAMSRWLLVLCVLAGFCGQMALQTQSRLGETPRATFERLTGLSIGTDNPADDMPMDMAMPMPHQHSGHHHDGSCPLCPLLHLPAVALLVAVAVLLNLVIWSRWQGRSHAVRAPPPGRFFYRPPATGPPLFD